MDRAASDAVWSDGRCGHAKPAVELYGLCATLSCPKCGTTLLFLLRFWHPKTFRVTKLDDMEQPVNRTTVRGANEFIFATAAVIFRPKGDANPDGDSPERDRTILSILMDTWVDDKKKLLPPIDFERPWRDIYCQHGFTSCWAYDNTRFLECNDCAAELKFTLAGKSGFYTNMARLPLEPTEYGLDGADVMVKIILEFADALELLGMMVDRDVRRP